MRPAAELLLLAELVGLVVLERHQLFEPVHERVAGIETHVAEMRATLGQLCEQLGASGQVTMTVGVRETLQMRERLLREALIREHSGPQILRFAVLSGTMLAQDMRELGDEMAAFQKAVSEFQLLPDSPMNARGHRWSIRGIFAWGSVDAVERCIEYFQSNVAGKSVLNSEFKILVRAPEAVLSPNLITRPRSTSFLWR
jgi:hypothetical protein